MPPRKSSILLTEIRQRLDAGEWRPGDMLPDERSLAAGFGVARNTVRKILAELESDGLIERHVGRGTIVSQRPDMQFAGILDNFLDASPIDILNLRIFIEPFTAEAAARQLFIESDLLLRPEEALTAVDLAQALGDAAPDPWRAWLLANNTGIARWAADDPQGALREYERALAALADDASASYERSITEGNVGLALALNGQCVAALPRFEAALRDTTALVGDRHPSTARAALQIGSCLVGAGQLEAARRRLGEAIAALPDDYDELADWITWTMARERVARRWYAAARSQLDERLGKRLARHAGPVDGDHAFYALGGVAAAGEGDFEAGWIAVEAAVDKIPASDGIELFILLGDVLGDQGDYEGAARAFERAVELGDRAHLQGLSLPARVGLVDVRLAQGERAAATESLEAAEETLAARSELGSEIVAAQVRRARGDLLLDAGSVEAAFQAHVSALELLADTDPEFGPRLDADASALRSRVAAKGRSAGADAAAEALIERYAAGGPGFAVDAARLREGLATFAERVGATDDAPLP